MSDIEVISDVTIVHNEESAIINAPIEKVDIADWLLHLPDAEYQRCAPPDHKAAGYTTTDDGRPMSINVEEIGGSLLVQHYVAEVHEPHHCRMVSLTDVKTPTEWTTIQVIWDLSVTAIDATSCRYTNVVTSHPTNVFMDFLDTVGQTFEQAAAHEKAAIGEHNRLETPRYAASLERKALATA